MEMHKPEILAPVGGPEQLIAAVRAGADAVYLGTTGFNARQNAQNFSLKSLSDVVSYCHGRGVAVHVTVNTLVTDQEMDALEEAARSIADSGADAVIIQDLAVMKLFSARCPTLARHASTQMVIHNLEGAKAAQDLGFHRVVLARELSLKEIEKIADGCDIDLEVFIHGALCVCLSGACYMSSVIGERSGNRGLCAQPCRTDFKFAGRNYVLSLKDLAGEGYIRSLTEAGVSSFKIEGRMKRPEYVAAVVDACVKARAGQPYDMETLKAVFSRSGFTDGHIRGVRNATMFGVRTQEDFQASREVLSQITQLYRRERQSVPVTMALTLAESEKALLEVKSEAFSASVQGPMAEKAVSAPADKSYLEKSLAKTGGTPFYLQSLEARIAPGVTLPASALNAMRREALEKLLEKRSATHPHPFLPAGPQAPAERHISAQAPALWGRFQSLEQICQPERFERVILPLTSLAKLESLPEFPGKLSAELPPAAFPDREDAMIEQLIHLRDRGLQSVYTENLYGIRLGRRLGLEVLGGPGLNVLNTQALRALEEMGVAAATVSFELMLSKAKALGGTLPRGILGYGRLPLMRIRACPARDKTGCGSCSGMPVLTDRTGVRFPLLCSERNFVTVLNSLPLYVGDKNLKGMDFALLYFTLESPQECDRVISAFVSGGNFEGKKTAGLYFRAIK